MLVLLHFTQGARASLGSSCMFYHCTYEPDKAAYRIIPKSQNPTYPAQIVCFGPSGLGVPIDRRTSPRDLNNTSYTLANFHEHAVPLRINLMVGVHPLHES